MQDVGTTCPVATFARQYADKLFTAQEAADVLAGLEQAQVGDAEACLSCSARITLSFRDAQGLAGGVEWCG